MNHRDRSAQEEGEEALLAGNSLRDPTRSLASKTAFRASFQLLLKVISTPAP